MAAKRKGFLGNVGPSSGRMRGSNISPPVHFFKVILRSTIEDQQLKLPKKFGREFGNDLSAVATITVPNGRTWQVGLQKTEEGRVLFVDCWQEFVEYLSIDSGCFLVFGYKGFSKFNVCIFDKTGREIDYPWINAPSSDVEPPHFDKDSAEEVKDDNNYDDDDDDDVDELMFVSRRYGSKNSKQRKSAIRAARSCKPTRHFFMISLLQTRINKYLHVPVEFAKKYVQSCSKLVTLEAINGKQWNIRLNRYGSSHLLCKGWCGFVRDNDLKKGDVCVFELIKQKDILLKVSIYYADPAKKCFK